MLKISIVGKNGQRKSESKSNRKNSSQNSDHKNLNNINHKNNSDNLIITHVNKNSILFKHTVSSLNKVKSNDSTENGSSNN